MSRPTRTLCAVGALACGLALAAGASPALADSPWWHLSAGARPSYLPPGGEGQIVLTLTNLGDAAVEGATAPVTITDTLPEGLRKTSIEAIAGYEGRAGTVECSLGSSKVEPHCTFAGQLVPYDAIEVRIGVEVRTASSGELNHLTVAGGGAEAASISRPITVSGSPTPFGVEDYELLPEEEGGGADTQAGSHPFQMTTALELNQTGGVVNPVSGLVEAEPAALPKDLSFKLPPGLVGNANPNAFARCTLVQFADDACSPQTAVGVAVTTIDEPRALGLTTLTVPVYNVEPAEGEPARFAFRPTAETPVFIDTAVRTGGDYGVTASVNDIVQVAGLLDSTVTLWGVPGDPRHDAARGEGCLKVARGTEGTCASPEEGSTPPFLTLPTSCSGQPLQSSLEGDSWSQPGVFHTFPATTPLPTLGGCASVPFAAEIGVEPGTQAASSPSGLAVDVKIPQEGVLNPDDLYPSDLQDTTVTLPQGLTLNPAAAGGLLACSLEQVGLEDAGEAGCPPESKVATVEITTPLLASPLQGEVYLAAQNANPFGSLIAMYLVAEDREAGVLVKLAGRVSLDPASGQITTTFTDTPQLPFEDLRLRFFGGERATLATPARCGSYTTTATFAPWSGGTAASPSSSFQITSGCPGASLPFTPSLAAGSDDLQAGGFTPLTTTLAREDGQQALAAVQLRMPPGLTGLLPGVKPCGEAEGDAGTCGPESLIGEASASVGVGSEPYTVSGGRVYLTGPYEGAPFGLSIVEPAKAGPYDLEHDTSNPDDDDACDCVVVRAKLEVDPRSAQLTVSTDTTGSYRIPTILDGVPLQIRDVTVTVDRPDFTLNPTSCEPMSVSASMLGSEGATQSTTAPFHVAECAKLTFAPKLAVTTAGHASKADGASLQFKISYPGGALGSQAWFSETKFDFPKQLPARLTTLQKACLAAVFEADRAACPAASLIGHATVHTQVLPVPLTGPVYFVSYGAAKFPEAVMVLQGDGVTVELHGETFIDSKTGITSATFRGLPEVPFETVEVSIPSGPYSEFGTDIPAKDHYDLCGQKLVMPTLLRAANGLEIHQNTTIAVTGCHRSPTRAQKLARALAACRRERDRRKRERCEAGARRRYPVKRRRAGKHRAKRG